MVEMLAYMVAELETETLAATLGYVELEAPV